MTLRTLSVGLLQLSYGDQERHAGCPLEPMEANITDPAVNLRCGVAILRNQLAARNTLFPRRYYYWSVLTRKRQQIERDFVQHRGQLEDLALLVLGPKRLPEAGRSLGQGMRGFRNALDGRHSDADETERRPS